MSDDVTILRDKIAEILYNKNPETQAWDGDPYSFYEAKRYIKNSYCLKLAYCQADALLKQFLMVDVSTVTFEGDAS